GRSDAFRRESRIEPSTAPMKPKIQVNREWPMRRVARRSASKSEVAFSHASCRCLAIERFFSHWASSSSTFRDGLSHSAIFSFSRTFSGSNGEEGGGSRGGRSATGSRRGDGKSYGLGGSGGAGWHAGSGGSPPFQGTRLSADQERQSA